MPTFQDLRLPVATMKKIADNSRGLVLVTGITGSGKSSTLAAMVDYINETRAEHIMTIEDPIEFVHKDKKAIITPARDRRGHADLRRRPEDGHAPGPGRHPDRRDARPGDDVRRALTAAQTGHLVFSTLHTSDSIQTISRIIDLYPPHQQALMRIQLAESLKAVVSQRLLPCIKGGRVPAVEIMIVTPHVRKNIEENNAADIAQATAKGQFYGMQTFNQSLVKLFKDGLVKEEDVMEAATEPGRPQARAARHRAGDQAGLIGRPG